MVLAPPFDRTIFPPPLSASECVSDHNYYDSRLTCTHKLALVIYVISMKAKSTNISVVVYPEGSRSIVRLNNGPPLQWEVTKAVSTWERVALQP